MLENIKTEIVYYKIPKDFELEFNICGCCNMRLLTSTEEDENKLLSVMARAIERNKIIIITGLLNDDTIEKIASSIGYETETVDNAKIYHTNSPFNKTIKGSVPLITEQAILGGCIVECGPQCLILLSSEKPIQREIMKNLIEPYIHAVSELENNYNDDITADTAPSPDTFEEQIVTTEADDFTVNDDTENAEEQVEVVPPLQIDPDEIIHEEPEKTKKGFTVATLIILILLLAVLGLLAYFLVILPVLNSISVVENFKNIFGFLLN